MVTLKLIEYELLWNKKMHRSLGHSHPSSCLFCISLSPIFYFCTFQIPEKPAKLFITSHGFLYLQPLLSSHMVDVKLYWMKFYLLGDFSLTTVFQGILHPNQLALRNPQRGCICELRINNSGRWQGALVNRPMWSLQCLIGLSNMNKPSGTREMTMLEICEGHMG